MQIIEFPVVLLQWRHKKVLSGSKSVADNKLSNGTDNSEDNANAWELVIVDEFRRFVRPTWRPKLSKYCTDLTGITQVSHKITVLPGISLTSFL